MRGAKAIAGAIEKIPQIQLLNLGSNEIYDEGAKAIALVIEKIPLQKLDLSCNQISEMGAKVLQQAKTKSRTLQLEF